MSETDKDDHRYRMQKLRMLMTPQFMGSPVSSPTRRRGTPKNNNDDEEEEEEEYPGTPTHSHAETGRTLLGGIGSPAVMGRQQTHSQPSPFAPALSSLGGSMNSNASNSMAAMSTAKITNASLRNGGASGRQGHGSPMKVSFSAPAMDRSKTYS